MLVNLFVLATIYPGRAGGQVRVVRATAAVQCGHGEIPQGGSQAGVGVAGQTPVCGPSEEAGEGPGQPGVGEQQQHLEPPQHHQRPGILQQTAYSAQQHSVPNSEDGMSVSSGVREAHQHKAEPAVCAAAEVAERGREGRGGGQHGEGGPDLG